MSDEPEKSEKTEDPSSKKLDDAHKKGDVAKSQEVTTWFMILGSALMFSLIAPITAGTLMGQLANILANADRYDLGGSGTAVLFTGLARTVFVTALLPLSFLAIFAIAGNLVQHKLVWSLDPIKPKFSKISPLEGSKRLLGMEALVNFAKGLIKLSLVAGVMVLAMWGERDRLDSLIGVDLRLILADFEALGIKIFIAILAVVTIIAIADFMYQRNRFWEKQKMTVREVRDEYKNMEGDPQIKSRIRKLRADKSRQRMMAAVPEATVVITNPTHFAVALKYDKDMPAPVCVAKGADNIALRIRELAKKSDVTIVENPPLARALYASVEINDSIPTEHFRAVAQVIGYVMGLRQKTSWRS
ncbi:Flagellar biosynthesis protein FlhB [hydrothermal vent metagenome]|uniref:Flagellar biosynthetic protein FlhB n=1 Tax=hydrothermal vent metagenome TaxID=652676 RepID=A0A3B0UAT4_9ZZZZ